MIFEVWDDPGTGSTEYKLVIPAMSMLHARFYPADRGFLKLCEDTDSIADKLIGLEVIARRIEEYYGG